MVVAAAVIAGVVFAAVTFGGSHDNVPANRTPTPSPTATSHAPRATGAGIYVVDPETGSVSFVGGPTILDPRPTSGFSTFIDGVPNISRDGTKIAFTVKLEKGFEPSGTLQVFVMNADGTGIRQLTHCRPQCSGPVWSPDGSKIAFAGGPNTQGNPDDVYVMDADGRNMRRVEHLPGEEDNFDWSPDGTKIVFDTFGSSAQVNIWTLSVADGSMTRLIQGGSGPIWSPDGRWIAFERRTGIWLMRPDGGDPHFLAAGSPVSWSPDGGKLVAGTDATGSPFTPPYIVNQTYAVVNVQTGEARTLGPIAVRLGAGIVFRWPAG